MEFQSIINLLDITSDDKNLPRYVTKKWIDVYYQSEQNYNINKEIKFRSDLDQCLDQIYVILAMRILL